MSFQKLRKPVYFALGVLAAWLGVKYLLPVGLPFILGALLALAAEPVVSLLHKRLRLPRGLASGIGVGVMLCFLGGVLSLVGALAVKELGRLAGAVPDLEGTAREGLQLLRDWLIGVTEQTPEGMRPMLTRTVLETFDDGTVLMEQAVKKIPKVVSGLLGWVPNGALTVSTGILAGFMLSARLPKLRGLWQEKWGPVWQARYQPVAKRLRASLGGWVRAQMKLMLVSFGILALGFQILGISYGILWALLIALVDAVPLFGTGTVLLPWALVCWLQQNTPRAIGLLGIWIAAMLTRTVLEPRLVGKQLGLDPLWTLAAMYLGCRFWGLPGMLFAPIVLTAVKSAVKPGDPSQPPEG